MFGHGYDSTLRWPALDALAGQAAEMPAAASPHMAAQPRAAASPMVAVITTPGASPALPAQVLPNPLAALAAANVHCVAAREAEKQRKRQEDKAAKAAQKASDDKYRAISLKMTGNHGFA